ncbi:MAG: ubiquinol-cytochrome c reductase iron-sulfur subunit [Litoreibacter sp.]
MFDTEARKILPRRRFLAQTTAGMFVGGLGLGAWGVAKTMAPSASTDLEKWATKLNLRDLPSGEAIIVKDKDRPVYVLRLNQQQIAVAREEVAGALHDPFARNENLSPDAQATFANRTLAFDGFIAVFDGRCPRLGCVPIFDAGDYNGWFCPCGGAHFDILGRFREGLGVSNLLVPGYRVTNDGELILSSGNGKISEEHLDEILYGKG